MGATIMTNELALQDIQFGVSYTPSEITIENEEQLSAMIDQVTAHYGSLVFTDDNIADAKKARADLNKIVKQLEDRRKEIAKDYSSPLKQFEEQMRSYVSKVTTVSSEIGTGIKDYDEKQKAIRLEKVQQEMAEIGKQFNVDPNTVEISTKWLTQSAFTTKGEVSGKTLDEIKDKMKIVAMEKERIEADKQTVQDFADLAGLDPYAWVELVDQGWNVSDIREKMKNAIDQKRIKEEEAAEQERLNAEYVAAMEQLEREQALQAESGALVNPDTGEIIESNAPREVVAPPVEGLMTVTLQLTAPQAVLIELNNYIIDHGIKVVPVE